MVFLVAVESSLVNSVLLLLYCAQQCFQLFAVIVLVIVFFVVILMTSILLRLFHGFAQLQRSCTMSFAQLDLCNIVCYNNVLGIVVSCQILHGFNLSLFIKSLLKSYFIR